MRGQNKHSAFTIVELLVVVTVVAILAAVTTVAYTGVRDKANDSARRSAVTQLKNAIEMLAVQKGGIPYIGGYSTTASAINTTTGLCPDNNGGGWVEYDYPAYMCDMGDMLKTNAILDQRFFENIPPNEEYGYSYRQATMVYHCGAKTYLYYYLKNPTSEETANLNNTITSTGCGAFTRDTYKMKAVVEISISTP